MSDVEAVRLRPAGQGDCRSIWEWRNAADVRAASLSSELIPLESHERWYEAALARPTTRIFVIVSGGADVGYVRFDLDGDEAEISIALAREARGRGLGSAAISAASDAMLREGSRRIVARVKAGNASSVAAFRRAGFDEDRVEQHDSGPVHVLIDEA
jgi:RimJ/RimL family protein N-acetyltransferase